MPASVSHRYHRRRREERAIKVTLLYFDGCPNWQLTSAHLEMLAAEIGFDLDRRTVDTPEDAERLNFRGSPTVLVDDTDLFANEDEPVGLSCRVYRTDDGLAGAPTERQLRKMLTAWNAERPMRLRIGCGAPPG
jgi:hypothetical protein